MLTVNLDLAAQTKPRATFPVPGILRARISGFHSDALNSSGVHAELLIVFYLICQLASGTGKMAAIKSHKRCAFKALLEFQIVVVNRRSRWFSLFVRKDSRLLSTCPLIHL